MLRGFLRDSAVYGVASFLARGVSIFLVPIYTRVLAPADYGAIDIVTIVAGIVASVVPLEIGQAVARFFPDQPEDDEKRGYASTSLWYVTLSYSVFLIVAWVLADPIAAALLGPSYGGSLIRVAAIAMCGNGIFYIVQSQLRWSLRAREYAVAGVVYTIASIGTSVVLVIGLRMGVFGVFVGQSVGAVVGIIVSARYAASYYSRTFNTGKLRDMLRFSVPLVPSTLGVLVAMYVDRLAINALMSLSAVGLFGIGYRIASLPQLVLIGFQTSITPLIYATHRDSTAPAELARIFRVFSAMALTLWLVLGLFARDIVAVVTTPEYYGAAAVVPLLVPAVLFAGAYVFMPGLAITKRTSQIAAINITGGVLNLLLNLALIPILGIPGAATATLISSAATFSLNVIASQRAYPVPHHWRPLVTATAIVGAIVAAGWILLPLTIFGFVAKVGSLMIGVAAMVALGLVRVQELGRAAAYIRGRA
jgi:Membrane protein involved in the export of O-antigen and teichoic acid